MIDLLPLSESLAAFCATLYPPHDDTEIALARHCAQHPLDETAALAHADCLQELGRPFLAAMGRHRAAVLEIQRNLVHSMIQSLCVPESVLKGAESGYSGRSVSCMTSLSSSSH